MCLVGVSHAFTLTAVVLLDPDDLVHMGKPWGTAQVGKESKVWTPKARLSHSQALTKGLVLRNVCDGIRQDTLAIRLLPRCCVLLLFIVFILLPFSAQGDSFSTSEPTTARYLACAIGQESSRITFQQF